MNETRTSLTRDEVAIVRLSWQKNLDFPSISVHVAFFGNFQNLKLTFEKHHGPSRTDELEQQQVMLPLVNQMTSGSCLKSEKIKNEEHERTINWGTKTINLRSKTQSDCGDEKNERILLKKFANLLNCWTVHI